MRLDPRRNLAATAAGILGVALFVAIELSEPTGWYNPLRLILLAAGIASIAAGSWPSRRRRFLILLGVVPTLVVIGFLALFSVGLAILLIAAVNGFALVVEYFGEGRD